MKIHEGNLISKNYKYAIIIARFNDFINSHLLGGAIDFLKRHDTNENEIEVFYVPGAFEIPLTAKKVAKTEKFDGIICLGTVIRGDTPHFEYVSSEVSKGIANVSLSENLPISFGVLTTDTIEQAIERAGTKAGNKGWDAAQSVLEQINLFKDIQ